jgi:hypothetical protein
MTYLLFTAPSLSFVGDFGPTYHLNVKLHIFYRQQLKTYKADIVQEDGSEQSETVDEAKNLIQVKDLIF